MILKKIHTPSLFSCFGLLQEGAQGGFICQLSGQVPVGQVPVEQVPVEQLELLLELLLCPTAKEEKIFSVRVDPHFSHLCGPFASDFSRKTVICPHFLH